MCTIKNKIVLDDSLYSHARFKVRLLVRWGRGYSPVPPVTRTDAQTSAQTGRPPHSECRLARQVCHSLLSLCIFTFHILPTWSGCSCSCLPLRDDNDKEVAADTTRLSRVSVVYEFLVSCQWEFQWCFRIQIIRKRKAQDRICPAPAEISCLFEKTVCRIFFFC